MTPKIFKAYYKNKQTSKQKTTKKQKPDKATEVIGQNIQATLQSI